MHHGGVGITLKLSLYMSSARSVRDAMQARGWNGMKGDNTKTISVARVGGGEECPGHRVCGGGGGGETCGQG